MSQILPTHEPFYFPGGTTGCLLIHGLTGTPKEMRWMGEFLAGKGYTVLGIRLPGHATRLEDLRHVSWQDWLAVMEDSWAILQGECQKIFLIGFSLGGSLSLLLASQKPVAGIISLSNPYYLPQPKLHRWLKILQFILPNIPVFAIGQSNWIDKEAERTHFCYPRTPTHAVVEVIDLLGEMRLALPQVKTPTLLIHSRNDRILPQHNLTNIYEQLGSENKQILWVENSSHNLPRDAERFRIFQAAHEFIQSVSQASP